MTTLTDCGLVAVMMTLFGTITSAQYTAGKIGNSLALQVRPLSLPLLLLGSAPLDFFSASPGSLLVFCLMSPKAKD